MKLTLVFLLGSLANASPFWAENKRETCPSSGCDMLGFEDEAYTPYAIATRSKALTKEGCGSLCWADDHCETFAVGKDSCRLYTDKSLEIVRSSKRATAGSLSFSNRCCSYPGDRQPIEPYHNTPKPNPKPNKPWPYPNNPWATYWTTATSTAQATSTSSSISSSVSSTVTPTPSSSSASSSSSSSSSTGTSTSSGTPTPTPLVDPCANLQLTTITSFVTPAGNVPAVQAGQLSAAACCNICQGNTGCVLYTFVPLTGLCTIIAPAVPLPPAQTCVRTTISTLLTPLTPVISLGIGPCGQFPVPP
ncbi:hypothetical protein GQ44DRAFT_772754 [Phaeosphaeriaceae sp. PMI808]|nr:hypothetical protein GQ44DRAFT_772754 [Phaeosphaeriaceae sp. PMI808]